MEGAVPSLHRPRKAAVSPLGLCSADRVLFPKRRGRTATAHLQFLAATSLMYSAQYTNVTAKETTAELRLITNRDAISLYR